MNDRLHLLASILEEPEDDLVRLAYADWCEENDDLERAEFIRLQIELATLPVPMTEAGVEYTARILDHETGEERTIPCPHCSSKKGCRYHEIAHRAQHLLDKEPVRWPIQKDSGPTNHGQWMFRDAHCDATILRAYNAFFWRGFLDKIDLVGDSAWVRGGYKILASQPVSQIGLLTSIYPDIAYGSGSVLGDAIAVSWIGDGLDEVLYTPRLDIDQILLFMLDHKDRYGIEWDKRHMVERNWNKTTGRVVLARQPISGQAADAVNECQRIAKDRISRGFIDYGLDRLGRSLSRVPRLDQRDATLLVTSDAC